jgi:hypothetical protein
MAMVYSTNNSIYGITLPKVSKKSFSTDTNGNLNLGIVFNVNATNGQVNSGSLNVNGTITTANSIFINNDTIVLGNDGIIVAKKLNLNGNLSIGDGIISINNDGSIVTMFPTNGYVPSDSSSNTTTTTASGNDPMFGSTTSNYLTTQDYVDREIWKQTKRINTILGKDNDVLDSFNNVYKVITAVEGLSSTVAIINNISSKYDNVISKSTEIVTSVSNVVAQAQNTVIVNCTPGVWKQGCQPYPIPYTITSLSIQDGWYFKNYIANTKINWYLPPNGSRMSINDIQLLYINIFAISNISLPIITIYTQPKNDASDIAPGVANAKINYFFKSPTNSTSANTNTSYCLYTNTVPMNIYNTTPSACFKTLTSNGVSISNGTGSKIDTSICSLTDKIAAFVIETDNSTQVNNIEFIISSFNIQMKTGNTQFLFQNSAVAVNYLYQSSYGKNIDLSSNSDAQNTINGILTPLNDYNTLYF